MYKSTVISLCVAAVPVAIVFSTIFVVAVVGSGVVAVVAAINHQTAAHLRTHQLILHLLLILAMLMATATKQSQKYHRLLLGNLPCNFKF